MSKQSFLEAAEKAVEFACKYAEYLESFERDEYDVFEKAEEIDHAVELRLEAERHFQTNTEVFNFAY